MTVHSMRITVVATVAIIGLPTGSALSADQAVLAVAGKPSNHPKLTADDLIAEGQRIFRFDTFGDEQLWTKRLRLHEVVQKSVDPTTALSVGLKVDADVLPPGILADRRPEESRDDGRALEDECHRRYSGHRRLEQSHHSARGHLRAVSLHGRRLRHAGDRSSQRRLAEPRPQRRRDHCAVAGADRRTEGRVLVLGPGQIRSALQPGRKEHAARDPAGVWARARSRTKRTRRRDRSPIGMRTSPSLKWAGKATSPIRGSRSTSRTRPISSAPSSPALRAYQHSLPVPRPAATSFNADGAARGRVLFNRNLRDLPRRRERDRQQHRQAAQAGRNWHRRSLRRAYCDQGVPYDAAAWTLAASAVLS